MSQENTTSKQPLIRYVNRQQMSWRAVDVDKLIAEDHRARAIWTLVGRLDLSPFYRTIESSTEEGGRPAFDPQLLISLWVYAYSQGIGSAREVARRCGYDPAFQWLTGWEEVNYHTLADFRVEKQQELDELFTQVLAALSQEGLITLEQVMQDGTKIKALASSRSYCQEETIREHLERARRRVAEMGDPRNEESSPKAKQAQVRARRQQQDRLEQRLEKKPQQMVADSGYTTRENIEKMAGREIDFLGTMRYENVPRGANMPNRFPPSAFPYLPEKDHCVCPQGQVLHPAGQRKRRAGVIYHLYEARLEDCQACPRKPACCPDNQKRGRSVAHPEESPVVIAFRKKMASEEARKQYRRRGRIVEFCHAWIKSKLGLRQFHVRGLKKVQMEMLWACLTYNLQHWIRLSKLRTTTAIT